MPNDGQEGAPPTELSAAQAFTRSPFVVRGRVVAVWRSIPHDIWDALSSDFEGQRARRIERRAIVGVAVLSLVLLFGFGGLGFRATSDSEGLCFPLLGRSVPCTVDAAASPGWYYRAGQRFGLAAWTVVPPLLGWLFVRGLWIPSVGTAPARRTSRLTLARHLGSVYLFVYAAIALCSLAMPLLIVASPLGTERFRWWLWCFLFGESFFVPAVMWIRLVLHDTNGSVFGRYRWWLLSLYLLLFVVVPLGAMVRRL